MSASGASFARGGTHEQNSSDKNARNNRRAANGGVDRRQMLLGTTSIVAASTLASAAVSGEARAAEQEVVLPKPEPPFHGKIGTTVRDSVADFPKGVEAPPGAPNILLIVTDDIGFGASSTFGGPIETPTFQRLADSGLRYNKFHTTALCSPRGRR
jgi:arylsulfatase